MSSLQRQLSGHEGGDGEGDGDDSATHPLFWETMKGAGAHPAFDALCCIAAGEAAASGDEDAGSGSSSDDARSSAVDPARPSGARPLRPRRSGGSSLAAAASSAGSPVLLGARAGSRPQFVDEKKRNSVKKRNSKRTKKREQPRVASEVLSVGEMIIRMHSSAIKP